MVGLEEDDEGHSRQMEQNRQETRDRNNGFIGGNSSSF